MVKCFIVSVLSMISMCIFSQEGVPSFDLKDTSIRCYVLGEYHTMDNFDHKLALIKELIKDRKEVLRIGFESQFGIDYYQNQYFENQQEDGLKLVCLEVMPKVYKENKRLMDSLRPLQFKTASGENGIQFFSFDIPLFGLYAAQIVLEQKCKGISEKLSFLETLRLKNHNLRHIADVYLVEEILNEFRYNELIYREKLGTRFEDIQTIMDGLEIAFNFNIREGSDKYYQMREILITKQVEKEFSKGKKMVLFVGNSHANLLEKDELYKKYYKSLTLSLEQNHPGKVYSISTQYLKISRLFLILRTENLLSTDPIDYFEDDCTRYKLIKGEELQKHPEATKRCNALLLYNIRRPDRKCKPAPSQK